MPGWMNKKLETGLLGKMSWYSDVQTPGDIEGQESLACCSPWDCKERDRTKRLNKEKQQICRRYHPKGRKRGTKEHLDEGEKGEWKNWFTTAFKKPKIMTSSTHYFMANRWGNNRNSDTLHFLGRQESLDSDFRREIQRQLFIGRKAMTNLDSILKSRDITLPTKVPIVRAMVFPVAHV